MPPTGIACADAFGDDSDDWPGGKVKIHVVKTSYAGKSVDGLRLEPIIVKPENKKPLDEDLDDAVPF